MRICWVNFHEHKWVNSGELGIDVEIARFYGKGNIMPYLGSDSFRDWAYAQRNTEEAAQKQDIQLFRPSIDEIVKQVAKITEARLP